MLASAGVAASRIPVAVASALSVPAGATQGRIIRVDPHGDIKLPSQAARLARDGDTVEIDPGIYRADVAVWPQSLLQIRARIPGTVRLPMGWLTTAAPSARRAVGRLIYPRGAVVHRMNLELPPAPDRRFSQPAD